MFIAAEHSSLPMNLTSRSVSGVGQLNVEWRRGEREVIELPKLKLRHRGQVRKAMKPLWIHENGAEGEHEEGVRRTW